MLEEIKILLWNRYGNQMYLIKSSKHKLSEALEIISYIQRINNEICPNFELPVMDICKVLVECFEFEMHNKNFFDMNKVQIMRIFGTVKRLKYHSMIEKSEEGVVLIELSDFWELYDGQIILKCKRAHSEISEIIKAAVRDNPNSLPWFL